MCLHLKRTVGSTGKMHGKGERCTFFSTFAANRLKTSYIPSQTCKVQQPFSLPWTAITISAHIKAHNERSRQPNCLALKIRPTAWMPSWRCRWSLEVNFGTLYDANSLVDFLPFSETYFKVWDLLHSDRGDISDNELTNAVFCVNAQVILEDEHYHYTGKIPRGFTVG